METEYRQVQGEAQELQALLEQRDDQLCTLNQDLLDLTVRMKVYPTPPVNLASVWLYARIPKIEKSRCLPITSFPQYCAVNQCMLNCSIGSNRQGLTKRSTQSRAAKH